MPENARTLRARADGMHRPPAHAVVGVPAAEQRGAVYFTVDTAGGAPVGGLTGRELRIYGDGSLVSPTESQPDDRQSRGRRALSTTRPARRHEGLGHRERSGPRCSRPRRPSSSPRSKAARSASRSTRSTAKRIHRDRRFHDRRRRDGRGASGRVPAARSSTNLHGAVVQGLATLDEALSRARRRRCASGTLVVVFTDGTDHAAASRGTTWATRSTESAYDVFAIGVGSEIGRGHARRRGGAMATLLVEDLAAITEAFREVGARIVQMTQRFYLLVLQPRRAQARTA